MRRWGNGCPLSKSINSRAATTVLAIFAPGVTYFLETAVPAAALTIDDGPDPDETPAILDVLRDHDAHATFFLIGSRIPGNDPLLAMREDVDDPQTLQPNRLTAEQVHAPETVLDVAKGGKPGGPVVVRRGTIMLLEDPYSTRRQVLSLGLSSGSRTLDSVVSSPRRQRYSVCSVIPARRSIGALGSVPLPFFARGSLGESP